MVAISAKPPVIKGGVDAGETQPRNQNHRHGLIATLPLAVLLAACGTGATRSSPSPSSPTPSSNPTTPITTLVPSPSPTAVPTPAPEPPLAVLSHGQELKMINDQGVEQWELTNLKMEQIFGLSAQQAASQGFGVTAEEAGPNLVLFGTTSTLTDVAVLSHAGTVLGTASLPSPTNGFYVSSPDGTEWAWSVDQTTNATGQHHGVIEVGGLGESVRTVYHWLAPTNFTEQLMGWYSTGIIVHRVESWGSGYDPAAAWFALNPTTGTLQELFTGNEQYLLARNGVTAAALINDPSAVLINGMQYAESNPLIENADPADISPDGAHVAVSRTNLSGGSGNDNPKFTIEIVTVADHSHIDLPNLTDYGWWNSNEILALTPSGDIWIYTLQGHPVSEIYAANSGWSFHGVML